MKETELWELLVSLSANEISLAETHDRILRLAEPSEQEQSRIGAISDSFSFEDWLNKYFETPKMKMMYRRKDGKGEYDREKLITDYKRAFRQS
jgi:hypothetical protein